METDSASALNARPPPLTSDQLNYLIWRYLQESGYADAAVKLQRDWKVDAESLPFAKGIKGHALVSLVQKGLRYHHLSLTIDENGRPSKQLDPTLFFFGPESEKPPPELREESVPAAPSPDDSVAAASRKHPRDGIINGLPDALAVQPAPKRGRKTAASSERNSSVARKTSASNQLAAASTTDVEMTNGHPASLTVARSPSATEAGVDENGPVVNGTKPDERMDVDEESPAAEHPESHVEAVPPPVHTLATGSSVGIQVAPAKVANLASSTHLLQLPPRPGSDVSRTLARIEWRPGDSRAVTAIGDDYCGVWDVTDHSSNTDLAPPFQELLESTEKKLVSAVAWEPNGEMLAVATYGSSSGQILLFDGQELSLMEALPASQRAITSLMWHTQGLRLMGIAPYDTDPLSTAQSTGSSILLWDLSKSPSIAGPSSVFTREILEDADCASFSGTGILCAAGENVIYYCRAFSDLVIEERWVSDPKNQDQWTFVRCAWHGERDALLVAASGDTGAIWMPAQDLFKRGAHDGPITGLELRPRSSTPVDSSRKQEFATSSMDGTVKVWRFDAERSAIVSVCKLIIGHSSPMMALSYSPDGFCLAGASYETIRIWNAEHGHNHMATWKDEQNAWNGSRLKDDDIMSVGAASSVNGEVVQSSADHSLKWDPESKKLAFGLGSQVALIDFQR